MFDKVLVTAPTASAKQYCFIDWLHNAMDLKYPSYNMVLFDNTLDDGAYVAWMNDTFKDLYGNSDKFKAIHSNIKGIDSVIERMCISHNDCRQYAIDNNYDYIFHLETDVFCPSDIIENLMQHRKQVVGGVYYIGEGLYRSVMIQKHIHRSPNNIQSINLYPGEDAFFCDGSLKKVSHVGLGCVLIHKSVLNIPFRFEKGLDLHPDSLWAKDLHKNRVEIWSATGVCSEHRNRNWGIYSRDFK